MTITIYQGRADHNYGKIISSLIEQKLQSILLPARKIMLSVLLTATEPESDRLGFDNVYANLDDKIFIPNPTIEIQR